MVARQSLPALVARHTQRQSVLGSELLEFRHDARGDDGVALGVEAVHHGLEQGQLALHRVTEEIGVDEDVVGRHEGRIVLEEHVAGHLLHLAHQLALHRLLLLELLQSLLLGLVLLESRVAFAEDSFDLDMLSVFGRRYFLIDKVRSYKAKLSRLLGDTHDVEYVADVAVWECDLNPVLSLSIRFISRRASLCAMTVDSYLR